MPSFSSILLAVSATAVSALEMRFHRTVKAGVNPTHYGNPNGGCMSDELNVNITGISGDLCTPPCDANQNCPTDYPAGVTATGECVLEVNGASTPTYCVLICDPTVAGDCGPASNNGACQAIQGTGVCTYNS